MPNRISAFASHAKRHPAAAAASTLCLAVAALCLLYLFGNTPPWKLDRLWQRHADLKPGKIDDYIAFGLWTGAAAATFLTTVLALTTRLWARPRTGDTVELGVADGFPARRFWIAVAAIATAAGLLRAPRLAQPLWGDEAWAYSDLVGGKYAQHDDGSLDFRRHPWKVTCFKDKGGNNQYLFTIAARWCNDIWQNATGAPPHAFSEAALRAPPFLAGLLSIAAAALLLRRLGYSEAGLALAALLAVHPWHVRYSTEARGYTMLILCILVALYFLTCALATDRRRWWFGFALAEFAGLYTWKAAIHPFAAINLVAIGILCVRLRRRATVPVCRCFAANAAALAAFIVLFAPALPQLELLFKRSTSFEGAMDMRWAKNVVSQLLGAMDWANSDTATPFDDLTRLAKRAPALVWGFVLVVVPAAAGLGLVRISRRRPGAALLLLAPALGSLFAFAHFGLKGIALHKWYLFYALPVLFALVALGITNFVPKGRRWLRPLPAAIFAVFYLSVFGHQLRTLLSTPIHDTRGADALARDDPQDRLDLGPSELVTLGLYRRVTAYDPRIVQYYGEKRKPMRSAALLEAALRDADAAGRPVRLSIANLDFARLSHPDFFAVVDDPRHFRKLARFPAIEPYIVIEVYEYLSGSITAADGQTGELPDTSPAPGLR